MKSNEQRRSVLKKILMSSTAFFGIGTVTASQQKPVKKVVGKIIKDQDIPLFSGAVRHGNTLYIAGKGAHFDGDIKSHTEHVLKELRKELERKRILNGTSFKSKCLSSRFSRL